MGSHARASACLPPSSASASSDARRSRQTAHWFISRCVTETEDNRYQYIAIYVCSLYLTLISLDHRLDRFDGLIPSGR